MASLLELRELMPHDEAQARRAHEELAAEGFDFLLDPGAADFGDYLADLERLREGNGLPENIVPSTFLAAFVDGELVGRVSIRHALNERLRIVGGHIGYAVRPGYRDRGYATAMLRLALARAADLGIDPALVTCDATNRASVAVIERCGGILDGTDAGAPAGKLRYWVPTHG